MIQIERMALALVLLLVTTGCYKHTYSVGQGAPAGEVVYEEWQQKWLAGLIGHTNLDVAEECPSGNASIHDEQTFLNGLVSVLTVGIYTPTTVRITCDSGRAAEIDLSAEQVRAILTSRAFLERVEKVMPGALADAQLGVEALKEDF